MAVTFKEALKKFDSKRTIASGLTSGQWFDQVPAALRDRALFSARVTNAQLLQGLRSGVESLLQPVTKPREGGTLYTAGIDLQALWTGARRTAWRSSGRQPAIARQLTQPRGRRKNAVPLQGGLPPQSPAARISSPAGFPFPGLSSRSPTGTL